MGKESSNMKTATLEVLEPDERIFGSKTLESVLNKLGLKEVLI